MLEFPVLSLFALASLLPQGPEADRNEAAKDPLIATVGGQEIRLADLIEEVNRQIPLNFYHRQVPQEKMAEFQRAAFDKLVVKHLIHQDALDAGLEATEADLRAEFEAALKEAGGQWSRLDAKERDSLFTEVRPALARRTLIRKNEELQTARVPKPDEQMIRGLYDDRVRADDTAFMAPKECHFFEIFVSVDPARIRQEEALKKAKIESALAEIQQGKPFAVVARSYSEDEYAEKGGDIGYQQSGSFRMKAVNAEAFALSKGQTSTVIRSLHGFHLVHCADVKPQVREPFEVMRPAIEEWLREEHLKQARERWLTDLRRKHPIKLLRPDLVDPKPEAVTGEHGEKKHPAPTTSAGK